MTGNFRDHVKEWSLNTSINPIGIQLELVQKSQDDFDKLEDIRENALDSQMLCKEPYMVLAFFQAFKTFLHRQGHWNQAAESAKRAIQAARCVGDKKQEAEATYQRDLIADETAVSGEAQPCFQKALELAQQVGAWNVEADIEHRKGWIAQMAGDGETAIFHYTKALNLHKQHHDPFGQIRAYRHLGMISFDRGEIQEASEYLRMVLPLFPDLPKNREGNRLRASVYSEMGRIARIEENIDDAKNYFEVALDLAKKAGDESFQQNILFQHTLLLENSEKYDVAEQIYKTYLFRSNDMENRRAQVAALLALGNLNFYREDYEKAYEYYDEALPFASSRELAIVNGQFGAIAFETSDYQSAKIYYQKSLMGFQEIGALRDVADCHQQLGIVGQHQYLQIDVVFHYEESLKIRRELRIEPDVVRSLYQLGTYYEQTNCLKRACKYYLEAYQLGKRIKFSLLEMIEDRLRLLDCKL